MPTELPAPPPPAPALEVFPPAGSAPGDPPARDCPDHLSAIIRVQEEIARAGLDLEVVMDLAARRARELTGSEGAAVALAEGEALVFRAMIGRHTPAAPWIVPIDGSFAGLCLRTGRGVACGDTEADPRADRDIYRRLNVRSLVVVPLQYAGKAVGVLAVNSPEPGRFGEGDLRTLTLIAGLVGAAVGHAAAFRENRALLAERTAALEALREGEDRFRAFMDNGPAVAFLKDTQGRYLYANAPMHRLVPPGHADLLGKTDSDWLPEATARITASSDRMALQAGQVVEVAESVVMPDGRLSHWLVFKFPVRDRHGRELVGGVGIDISDRKALERRLAEQLRLARELNAELERRRREAEQANTLLAELSNTDGLTGLKNIRYFRDVLAAVCDAALPGPAALSLILLDVDHFKAYNDAHGHLAGDEVLRVVGEALRASLRPGDLAARYGGEEFVILLPGTGAAAASAVADRLRAAIAGLPWTRRPVTASFGVATTGSEPARPDDIIDQADRALYRSKQGGRNRITHHRDPAG